MVANKTSKLPIRLFEVADVVIKREKTHADGWQDAHGQTFTVNRRTLCALTCDHDKSHFDVLKIYEK